MSKCKNKGVAVVTGGSSGIGKATCRALSSAGYTVYELSRKGGGDASAEHINCDVCDEEAVVAAIDTVIQKYGKIDVLINNAGMGVSGAIEFTPLSEAKRQFDVNFFGTFAVTKAVVPHMRSAGGGRIINIGSVAGELAIPYQAFYSACKAAIQSLTLAERNELKQFKISACAVLPGDVKTGFTQSRKKTVDGDDVYGGRIERAVSNMERDEENGMSPDKIAKKIVRLANKRKVKPFYTCGLQYKFFIFLARILPRRISNYIVGKLY